MRFHKDILVIDFEGTDTPAAVGAILLDKETLEEKDSFKSLIQSDLQGKTISGITQEMLVGAPSQGEVGRMIYEKFGTDVFLASWVANGDMTNFVRLMTAAGIDCFKQKSTGIDAFKGYDYHIIDIWPAAYIYMLKQGYEGSIRSEAIFQYFGAKPRGIHDPLEDCRIAAEVLRKIV
ncbi:MAG: hypothetical protein A2542_01540 [Parcubacteria group bacterium RIFOXYD2_FULL_52_8]|nr:MAG: hypothetical protein A2542_01540 [Parcubacteria group bacterium RIFOXYD2_FULL_52_8]